MHVSMLCQLFRSLPNAVGEQRLHALSISPSRDWPQHEGKAGFLLLTDKLEEVNWRKETSSLSPELCF